MYARKIGDYRLLNIPYQKIIKKQMPSAYTWV